MIGEPFFKYQNDQLYVENLALSQLAREYGSPSYIYSYAGLKSAYDEYQQLFDSHPKGKDCQIFYAVKANSNLAILQIFAKFGCGFDIVSQGELKRVLAVGVPANKIVFSGVGKSHEEISEALDLGIACFNVESISELERIQDVAKTQNQIAPISLRVNPDVDAKTHPYISTGLKDNKFGIAFTEALSVYLQAANYSHLNIVGIDCHIGSQILEPSPFSDALQRLLILIDQLANKGIELKHLDIGGGVGIAYQNTDVVPSIDSIYRPILQQLQNSELSIFFEPGRRLVGSNGLLLSKIEYLKQGASKNFAVIDAAMNDLMRPALYQAYHEILPIQKRKIATNNYDVVGPICESGDFIGKNRSLALEINDYVAIMSAGAYGRVMSSNYNSRPRACEILVDKDKSYIIAEREKIEDIYRYEKLLTTDFIDRK